MTAASSIRKQAQQGAIFHGPQRASRDILFQTSMPLEPAPLPTPLEQLETKLARTAGSLERIDLLNAIAWEMHDLGMPRALELAQAAYEAAQAEGYPKGVAESLLNLCQAEFNDYLQALERGMQALTLFEQLGDRLWQGRALYTLCWVHWSLDNFTEAVEAGQRARKLAQEIGDRHLEAEALNNLGLAYKRSGNYELADAVYHEALEIYRSLGDQVRMAKILTNLALSYTTQQQLAPALEYAQGCLELQFDNPMFRGYLYLVLGQIYTGLEEYDQAADCLRQALETAAAHEYGQLMVSVQLSFGQLFRQQQKLGLAIAHLERGLAAAQKVKSNLFAIPCHEALSQLYESQGDLAQALAHYKKFHQIKESVFDNKNTGRLQYLQTQHRTEIARQEAEIYHLRNIELENQIKERNRLAAQLRQQATTDELTGISNRRYFLKQALHELKRANRHHRPLSIALVDIDHFKKINDTYGHLVGDQALVAFTRVFQKNIREIDLLARFGGDEFILLLPETRRESARAVMERVRQELKGKPLALDKGSLGLTISVGVSGLVGASDLLDALLMRADQALYRAKEAGRDQVMVD